MTRNNKIILIIVILVIAVALFYYYVLYVGSPTQEAKNNSAALQAKMNALNPNGLDLQIVAATYACSSSIGGFGYSQSYNVAPVVRSWIVGNVIDTTSLKAADNAYTDTAFSNIVGLQTVTGAGSLLNGNVNSSDVNSCIKKPGATLQIQYRFGDTGTILTKKVAPGTVFQIP